MEVKESFSFITFLKAFTPTSASILPHLFSKTIFLQDTLMNNFKGTYNRTMGKEIRRHSRMREFRGTQNRAGDSWGYIDMQIDMWRWKAGGMAVSVPVQSRECDRRV